MMADYTFAAGYNPAEDIRRIVTVHASAAVALVYVVIRKVCTESTVVAEEHGTVVGKTAAAFDLEAFSVVDSSVAVAYRRTVSQIAVTDPASLRHCALDNSLDWAFLSHAPY